MPNRLPEETPMEEKTMKRQWELISRPGGLGVEVVGPPIHSNVTVCPVGTVGRRPRLVAILRRRARWAQEDAESHLARGDHEAAQLARERERTYTHAANLAHDPDQPEPLRARAEAALNEQEGDEGK